MIVMPENSQRLVKFHGVATFAMANDVAFLLRTG